jgi:hypothetical protein
MMIRRQWRVNPQAFFSIGVFTLGVVALTISIGSVVYSRHRTAVVWGETGSAYDNADKAGRRLIYERALEIQLDRMANEYLQQRAGWPVSYLVMVALGVGGAAAVLGCLAIRRFDKPVLTP